MAHLELKNINKIYPNKRHIIKNVNLTINDGEFTVFVGPSGCGKSTMLRMIAGLETITSGDFTIDGDVVNSLSPKDRGIGMVFQSYALYPHMTIFENIAFGLKLSKVPRAEIEKRVHDVAEMLELTPLLKQKPGQLSGGQRQRVAIGRAIVRNPKVFLLDEPLSNLDAALRVRMRLQLAEFHQKLKSTIVYVTHDQVEAMTLADKIVVLNEGKVEQAGSPLELYYFPQTLFVAGFIGSPKMNLIPANVVNVTDEMVELQVGDDYTFHANVKIPKENVKDSKPSCDYCISEACVHANSCKVNGIKTILGFRPEDVHLAETGISVIVEGLERLGTESLLYTHLVRGSQEQILVRVPGTVKVKKGEKLKIQVAPNSCLLFDCKGKAYPRGISLNDIIVIPPQFEDMNKKLIDNLENKLDSN